MRYSISIAVLLLASAACRAQPCQPYWRAGPPVFVNFGQLYAPSFAQFDDGAGSTVYVAHPYPQFSVWRWRGDGMELLPSTGLPAGAQVARLRVLDDGSGPALYLLIRISSEQFQGVKWNGSGWTPMPPAFYTAQIEPFESADTGLGSRIYGRKWRSPAPFALYRWNGATWDHFASMDYSPDTGMFARAGNLFVIGQYFNIGGVAAYGATRWDGAAWHPLPGVQGTYQGGWAVTNFDDGSGTHTFLTSVIITNSPGGIQQYYPGVFRFDGEHFSAVGYTYPPPPSQISWVSALRVFDDGRGPALYITGGFPQFGINGNYVTCNSIVRWDGQTFEPLGAGGKGIFLGEITGPFGRAMYIGQEVPGPIGGGTAPGSALWVGCPNCYANCDDSTTPPVLNIADFGCFLRKFAANDPYANCNVDATIDIADFACFMQKFAAGCQ